MADLNSYSETFWPSIKPHNAAFKPTAHPQITHDLLKVLPDSGEALTDRTALGAERNFGLTTAFWNQVNSRKDGTGRTNSEVS